MSDTWKFTPAVPFKVDEVTINVDRHGTYIEIERPGQASVPLRSPRRINLTQLAELYGKVVTYVQLDDGLWTFSTTSGLVYVELT